MADATSPPSAAETRAAVATLKDTLVKWVDELHRLENQRKQILGAIGNLRLANSAAEAGEAPDEWARQLRADADAKLSLHKTFLADREENTKRGEAIASAARVVCRFAHSNGIDAGALIRVIEHHQFAYLNEALFVLNSVEYLLPVSVDSPVVGEATTANQPEAPADPTEQLVDEENKRDPIWQQIAEQLMELRRQGKPYTSQHKLADTLGCAPGTVNKAIHSCPELTEWAKGRQGPVAPKAQQSLNNDNAVAADDAVQVREPDPSEAAEASELLNKLVQDASPEMRAFINAIRGATHSFLRWFLEQTEKKQNWCAKHWQRNVTADLGIRTWFLSHLRADDQIAYFAEAGDPPKAFPKA
jgi:hypothetical protein